MAFKRLKKAVQTLSYNKNECFDRQNYQSDRDSMVFNLHAMLIFAHCKVHFYLSTPWLLNASKRLVRNLDTAKMSVFEQKTKAI
jgi:hypothetical protein